MASHPRAAPETPGPSPRGIVAAECYPSPMQDWERPDFTTFSRSQLKVHARVIEHLARRIATMGPEEGLRSVVRMRHHVDKLEAMHVGLARKFNWPWNQIAIQLGVRRQSIHRRYARPQR